MIAITYTAARANLAKTTDRVIDDHDPVIITSLEDYQALEETAFLLRTPTNAARLLGSIQQLNAGKGTIREIEL